MRGFQVSDLSGVAWVHVHWISDVTQTSHLLSPLLCLPSTFPSFRVFSRNQLFTLKITLLAWEMTAIVWWSEHCLALPFLRNWWRWPFHSCDYCWVSQICWRNECSTWHHPVEVFKWLCWNSASNLPLNIIHEYSSHIYVRFCDQAPAAYSMSQSGISCAVKCNYGYLLHTYLQKTTDYLNVLRQKCPMIPTAQIWSTLWYNKHVRLHNRTTKKLDFEHYFFLQLKIIPEGYFILILIQYSFVIIFSKLGGHGDKILLPLHWGGFVQSSI